MDRCSFCGREKKDTNLLIAGISGHICDRCIEQAYSIVQEELGVHGEFDMGQIKLLKPTGDKKLSRSICDRPGRGQEIYLCSCLQPL